MQSDAKTVPAYLKELLPDRRAALSSLRKLIKRAAPDAKELMQSGMPCYVVDGCPVFALAAQKHYLALYVCAWNAMNKYRDKLGTANCGKGCIRFKRLEDLSLDVVEELLAAAADAARQAQ
ncbi:MAG: DUF1801 domain-containing protein [Pirellulaceae bacterium]